MPRRYRQAYSLSIANPEVVAQFEQNQRQTFLQCTAHEVGAAQLHQIPPPGIIGGHPLELYRAYPQANPDKFVPAQTPHVTVGDRLAAEVIVDADDRQRKGWNHSRRQHDHDCAAALSVAAGYARHSRKQDIYVARGVTFIENLGAL